MRLNKHMVQTLLWVLSGSHEQLLCLDPKPSGTPTPVPFPTSMNMKSETKEQWYLNHLL